MRKFQRFYLWLLYNEFYVCIYFATLMCTIALIKVLTGNYTMHVSLVLEVYIVSAICGHLQSHMLGNRTHCSKEISFLRYSLWVTFSVISITLASLIFKWFENMNLIYNFLSSFLLGSGFLFMILGLKFEENMDTIKLNSDLDVYKKNLERIDDHGND